MSMVQRSPEQYEKAKETLAAKKIQKEEASVETQFQPTTAAEAEGVYGYQIEDLEFDVRLGTPPNPPKCVMDNLKRLDRVWRWMSRPAVKNLGMRMYETYSPTEDERVKIKNGDAPPGVSVNVENTITWREDAFLASIPRRLFELRQAAKYARIKQQTDKSKNADALKEVAGRVGARANSQVQEWLQQGE